jgi:hypothetical protein
MRVRASIEHYEVCVAEQTADDNETDIVLSRTTGLVVDDRTEYDCNCTGDQCCAGAEPLFVATLRFDGQYVPLEDATHLVVVSLSSAPGYRVYVWEKGSNVTDTLAANDPIWASQVAPGWLDLHLLPSETGWFTRFSVQYDTQVVFGIKFD